MSREARLSIACLVVGLLIVVALLLTLGSPLLDAASTATRACEACP